MRPSIVEWDRSAHPASRPSRVSLRQRLFRSPPAQLRPAADRCRYYSGTIDDRSPPMPYAGLRFVSGEDISPTTGAPLLAYLPAKRVRHAEITPNRIADRMSRATEASLSGRRPERSRNAPRMRAADIRLPLPPLRHPPADEAFLRLLRPLPVRHRGRASTAVSAHDATRAFHGLPWTSRRTPIRRHR